MRKLKITEGDWLLETSSEVRTLCPDREFICETNSSEVYGKGRKSTNKEKANAEFISEAGTVANETGLMPREMAEINKELLEACKAAFKELHQFCDGKGHTHGMTILENVIAKAEGN